MRCTLKNFTKWKRFGFLFSKTLWILVDLSERELQEVHHVHQVFFRAKLLKVSDGRRVSTDPSQCWIDPNWSMRSYDTMEELEREEFANML